MMTDDAPCPTFDLEAVYDAEIVPLLHQVARLCKAHGIPMLASFCYGSHDGEQDFGSWSISRNGWEPDVLRDVRRALCDNAQIIEESPIPVVEEPQTENV